MVTYKTLKRLNKRKNGGHMYFYMVEKILELEIIIRD